MTAIKISELIKELENEVWHRNRVYTRLVDEGRMTDTEAEHKIACITVLAAFLRRIQTKQGDCLIHDTGAGSSGNQSLKG